MNHASFSAPSRPRSLLSTGLLTLGAVFAAALFPAMANAGALDALITDKAGTPLEHAVVSLHGDLPTTAQPGTRATMDQRQRQFDPTVVPIQAGTEVLFPNSDDVRHHVYSFSQPNAFELKLYHGEANSPILFDKPGIVVLGCNIHDGMIGYLHVVDTPLFAKTLPSGHAAIDAVPPGDYTLQVWHPDLGMRYLRRPITLNGGTTRLSIKLDRESLRSEKPAVAAAREVSPLQSLFRQP